MSRADVDIPFIDEKNQPSSISSINSKDKSIQIKKPTEKPKENVKSTITKTPQKLASPTKSRDSKPTSQNVTRPNHKPIGATNSERSKLNTRPQSAPEKVVRASKVQRPTSSSGGAKKTISDTAPQRSKQSLASSAKDTAKAKANTVVANKGNAINRTTATTATATTGTTRVNKTTTKQLSNNKVDSKSKIKEPLQQQTPNNTASKKCFAEKSPGGITAKLGGRRNISVLELRCRCHLLETEDLMCNSVIDIIFHSRCKIGQNDDI